MSDQPGILTPAQQAAIGAGDFQRPAGTFRPPLRRRAWTVGLIGANGVCDMVTASISLVTLSYLDRVKAGVPVDPEVGQLIDAAAGLTALVSFVVYLAAVVVFCCWFHRIVSNAALVATEKPPMSPGLSVGSFFIPFVCLYAPYRAAAFAWKTCARVASPDRPPPATIISVWWAVWILVNLIGQMIFRQAIGSAFSNQPPSLEEAQRVERLSLAMDGASAVSAAVCIIMVVRLTGLQRRISAMIDHQANARA